MATAGRCGRELGSAAGRAIMVVVVVSPLPICVHKGDIVGSPRRPKIIYPQAIILFVSRPIQIQGVLFAAAGEFAQNGLHHLPPRLRYLPGIMMITGRRHLCCFDFLASVARLLFLPAATPIFWALLLFLLSPPVVWSSQCLALVSSLPFLRLLSALFNYPLMSPADHKLGITLPGDPGRDGGILLGDEPQLSRLRG